MRGVIRLANGAGFRLESVRCWDRWPESPGTLRIHLGDGVLFNVNRNDTPSPADVESVLIDAFGPIYNKTIPHPFKGHPDLTCEVCGLPDRDALHKCMSTVGGDTCGKPLPCRSHDVPKETERP